MRLGGQAGVGSGRTLPARQGLECPTPKAKRSDTIPLSLRQHSSGHRVVHRGREDLLGGWDCGQAKEDEVLR